MKSSNQQLNLSASISLLVGVACIAVFASGSLGEAQSAGHSCGLATLPVPLVGKAPVVRGQLVNLMAFPQSKTGDQYLSSLAAANTVSTPQPGQSLTNALAGISNQMTSQQQLSKNLPSLYASAYGIPLDAKNAFACGGLPPGRYTLVAISQPTAPPATSGSPTPFPLNAGANAISALQASAQKIFYSWAIIALNDKDPLPQAPPANGATLGPPQYPTVVVPPFHPISQYPAHYFTH